MIWEKIGKDVDANGTTVCYAAHGSSLTIESRKRHIPHANGSGTWDHTSYFVMKDGVEIKEFYRLKDAKEFAEQEATK